MKTLEETELGKADRTIGEHSSLKSFLQRSVRGLLKSPKSLKS